MSKEGRPTLMSRRIGRPRNRSPGQKDKPDDLPTERGSSPGRISSDGRLRDQADPQRAALALEVPENVVDLGRHVDAP